MGFLDVIFYAFTVVVLIQVVFHVFIYSKFAFLKPEKASYTNMPVSVIICAKNEAKNLNTFLPYVIEQDYPNFEIVLINDASSDKTLKVMQAFAEKHNNIKIVDVKGVESFWGNKKYALTLGIKASSHEHLLFTDADCKPLSKQWISEMTALFSDKKSIVLGYGAYAEVKKSFLNKLIRFETLQTAISYFSFAESAMPYMGVGRNLAYTKTEFFKANGFIKHIKIKSGDDDLFINQIATSENTAIAINANSFTSSLPKPTFKTWFRQKCRHVSTAKHYKIQHKILLSLSFASQFLFWLLGLLLLITTFKWHIIIGLFLFRLIMLYVVYGNSAKKLNEKNLIPLFPVLEIFLILTQLIIFINNLISKPNYWK